MWHHRAVEHIRRSVKQRVDLVTVWKLQQRQNLQNHLGDQGSFLQFMVMMQLGAIFFDLNQIDSTRIILIHHFAQVLHYWHHQPFLFLCAKSSPRWSSFLETKLVLMGLDLPTTGLYVLFHLGSECWVKRSVTWKHLSWEKKPMCLAFLYIYDPHFVSTCSISPFSLSLSLSVDFFRRKRCIQNENFTTSQVLAGLPSLPLENLLLGPNILEKQRWLQL